MKRVMIIFIILMGVLTSNINANERIDVECLDLKDMIYTMQLDTVSDSMDIESRHNDIVMLVLKYLGKIIDSKYQVSNYLQDNKEIYGNFVASSEAKKEVDTDLQLAEHDRKLIVEKFDKSIKEIDPTLSRSSFRRLLRALKSQRRSELKNVDSRIKDLRKRKKMVDAFYYKARIKWASYEDEVKRLGDVERSLHQSLKVVAEVTDEHAPKLKDVISDLEQLKLSTIDGPISDINACVSMHDKILDLIQELKRS